MPNGNEIELRARGSDRKGLLNVIAAELESLNQSFCGLPARVEKLAPCICRACCAILMPVLSNERELQRRVEAGRLTMSCPESLDDVDLLALLDGIRTVNRVWPEDTKPTE